MLKAGDRVKIMLPLKEMTISRIMRSFHGKETTIVSVIRKKNSTHPQYKLKGCVSKYRTPFFFLGEWLIPLESEDSE